MVGWCWMRFGLVRVGCFGLGYIFPSLTYLYFYLPTYPDVTAVIHAYDLREKHLAGDGIITEGGPTYYPLLPADLPPCHLACLPTYIVVGRRENENPLKNTNLQGVELLH
ncbi:hypothetical protein VTJ04DRAFT_377 [Mycothermus thermophilus]|uniref:uncharacterized protein n=1 Tax=Humicola insolens TaxID=85995 RepID=UPI00374283A3